MNSLSRGVAAACLGLLLGCAALVPLAHAAVETEGGARCLVPVGHTVGVKLFADGVLVVGLSDGLGLLVRYDDGSIEELIAGEVHLIL